MRASVACRVGSIALAASLLSTSPRAEAPPPEPYFVDPARGPTPFTPEYKQWFGDDRRAPHRGRAALELTGLLAVGTAYYWVFPGLNRIDWITPDLPTKLLQPEVSFDNNMHRTNHLLHPFAGSMAYWLSRVNGLDVYESAAYSAASSAIFEFVLEFRETASINDMVFTPVGGIAAGELFFHLGDYLTSAPGDWGVGRRAFALTLGLPQSAHDALDDTTGRPASTPDELGYSSAYWHRFVLGYAAAAVSNERGDRATAHDLVAEADLVAMPGFLRPGHFALGFEQGNFTSMRLRASLGEGKLEDVDLRIGADLAGYYSQAFDGTEDALRGHASMVAANVQLRYVDRWLLGRRDFMAVAHVLGPSAKLWYGLGSGFFGQVEGDVHLDFASMGSPAYQQWIAQYGPGGTKSVLQMHGYYFGIGGSGRLAASIGYRGISAGGRAGYGLYRSIDGADQNQREIVHDDTNTDAILEVGSFVEVSPEAVPFRVRVGWEELRHQSRMGPFSADWIDQRMAASLALRF